MEKAINFYELKTELADLGFVEPNLVDNLRQAIFADRLHPHLFTGIDGVAFDLELHRDEQDRLCLTGYTASQGAGTPDWEIITFGPQITAKEAINHLKTNTMNTENLSYLQKQLLNMGFGEKLNDELEQKIKNKEKEFTLGTSQTYNKDDVNYTLHYKAGEQNDMYFFNKYEARHKDNQHTFYINKGSGITAKEAYNLLEGRSVHKQLETLQLEKYNAWIKLEDGRLRTFTDGWNYKPERAIDKLDIVGINEPGNREKLMKSLEKGNRHEVTAMKDGKEVKLFLEANPAEHRVNLTNWKGEAQQLEHYKKPEAKQEQKKAETQKQETSKKKSKGKKMSV